MTDETRGSSGDAPPGRVKWPPSAFIALGVVAIFGLGLLRQGFDPAQPAKIAAAPAAAPMRFSDDPERMGRSLDYSVLIKGTAAPGAIEHEAREFCADKPICAVHGWSAPANRARALPMLERESAARVFSYAVNRMTGYEAAMFDCRVVVGLPPERCLAR